jgi:CHRD domain/PEP-CTERM motif
MKLAFALPLVIVSAVCLAAPGANAAVQTFTVPLLGANEVPSGAGDPDGFGTAILMIDDVALTVDWNISVSNLDTVILDHIHSGAAGVNGPVVVDFSGQLSGSGLADPDLASVLANPTGFYVNVHTNTFPNGAIRGQVPEPTTALLLAMGLVGLAGSVRRYRH